MFEDKEIGYYPIYYDVVNAKGETRMRIRGNNYCVSPENIIKGCVIYSKNQY